MPKFCLNSQKNSACRSGNFYYNFLFNKKWSGKRGSNPRPLPWQGSALSTELFPHFIHRTIIIIAKNNLKVNSCDKLFFRNVTR